MRTRESDDLKYPGRYSNWGPCAAGTGWCPLGHLDDLVYTRGNAVHTNTFCWRSPATAKRAALLQAAAERQSALGRGCSGSTVRPGRRWNVVAGATRARMARWPSDRGRSVAQESRRNASQREQILKPQQARRGGGEVCCRVGIGPNARRSGDRRARKSEKKRLSPPPWERRAKGRSRPWIGRDVVSWVGEV